MRQRFTPWAVMAIVSLSGFSVSQAVAGNTRTSADDVITSVEGKEIEYTKTWNGCMQMFQLDWYENEQASAKIVFGDNNEVYFLDLISKMPMLSYVKGIQDGDKITVTLPQVVSYSDAWGFILEIDVNLAKIVGNDESFNMVAEEGDNTVTFTVADDGTITLDPLGEDYGIALMRLPGNEWYSVMEDKMQFVPTTVGVNVATGATEKEIVSERYFNLSGREVAHPTEGIYVKRTTYADGTYSSGKVML